MTPKSISSSVVFLALIASMSGALNSFAQTGRDWVDSTGTLELNFKTTRMRERIPRLNPGLNELELVGPNFSTAHFTLCGVLKPDGAGLLDGGTQEQINAKMRRKTPKEISPGMENNPTFRFAHRMIDGVSVIDFQFREARNTQRWIVFRVPAEIGAKQYSVACSANDPISAKEQSDMDAIMSSIRIRRQN